MALEIGAGITLGGGISLVVEGGAGGGGNELATGTITVGTQINRYGWAAGQFGDSTFSMMGPVITIVYDSAFPRTEVGFLTGTYGSVVIDFETVDGETSITAVIDGITETLTMDGSGKAIIANDPFDLANKVGQTLNVSITPGVADSGGGGNNFTIGDGKTFSIVTAFGAAETLFVTTLGEQAVLPTWASGASATLSKSGTSVTVVCDVYDGVNNNGDGTFGYKFYLTSGSYPGEDYEWTSFEFA